LHWLKKQQQGNEIRSLLYFLMVNETQIRAIESMVKNIFAAEPEYFLVEAKIIPLNNVKVFLDGDNGISIEKCVQCNRALYRKIEEEHVFPLDDFSLEVSSPGLDQPLKLLRQYKKNIGRLIDVVLNDGTKKTGRLVELTEDGIILEETIGKNKNKLIVNHAILFNNIKTTTIQIVF
jgi:ribosome maturation factor RimP